MSESRDLYLAILAMDAYNREYDNSLALTGNQIGDVTILRRYDYDASGAIYASWQDVGFYAIAYDTTGVAAIEDTITLSFRGTNAGAFETMLTDMVNGWTAALGDIDGLLDEGGQVPLALDFYRNITEVYGIEYVEPEDPDDPDSPLVTKIRNLEPGDLTMTGHSLGGGLAGVVAALYGTEAGLFDHMPYERVSEAILNLAATDP